MECNPKSLPLSIECRSCDQVLNKKDGTISLTQNPMKNIVLVAKQSSQTRSTFSWGLDAADKSTDQTKVFEGVQTFSDTLTIPATNSQYLKGKFDFLVKYGTDKASLTFTFTDYPTLDNVKFTVAGKSYKKNYKW